MNSCRLAVILGFLGIPLHAQIAFPDLPPPPSSSSTTTNSSSAAPPSASLQPAQTVPQVSPTPVTSPASVPTTPGQPQSNPTYTLYREGGFPAGRRLKPLSIMKEGEPGSWLIGKFICIDQDDAHHYTIKSHVDSIGIGLLDLGTHAGASPILVHLTIVQPPPGGLPREFSYGPLTPLKVTRLDYDSNEVWAVDLTRRR